MLAGQWLLRESGRHVYVATHREPDVYLAWFEEPSAALVAQLYEMVEAHNRTLTSMRNAFLSAANVTSDTDPLESRRTHTEADAIHLLDLLDMMETEDIEATTVDTVEPLAE